MCSVRLRSLKVTNVVAKNMQSNGQSLKHYVFCRVHWVLDSGVKELRKTGILFQ